MRRLFLPLAAVLLLLSPACNSVKDRQEKLDLSLQPKSEEEAEKRAKEAEEREVKVAIQERLQHIRQLISDGSLDKAQKLLSPMEPLEDVRSEVDALQKMIDASRVMVADKAQIALSKQAMEKEAEDKLILPKTYGQMVTVDANLEPISLPPGRMEQKVLKKVTINYDNLNVYSLVNILTNEGLNVVADKTLEKKTRVVNVHVTEVPLLELFAFLSRNMGIAFNIGENLVWITKGADISEDGEGSIVLETRTYQLPQGFIPDAPKSEEGGEEGKEGEESSGTTVNGSHDKDLEVALTAALAGSPEGATFHIFPTRNLVLVKNTRENLRQAEKIINDFIRPPAQVVIEARFITVSQDDLRDLGTEIKNTNHPYPFTANEELLQKLKDTYTGIAGDNQGLDKIMNEVVGAHGAASAIGKSATEATKTAILSLLNNLVPEYNHDNLHQNHTAYNSNFLTELGTLKSGNENGVGSLTISGIIGHRSFDILLSALDKKASAIQLSAPKITVLNNHSARIRKGDKIFYFEEYDLETVDNGDRGNDSRLVPSGTPVELPLGITFDVKVNVGNDLKTVLLSLHPEITELLKWEDYITSGGSSDSDSNSDSNSSSLA